MKSPNEIYRDSLAGKPHEEPARKPAFSPAAEPDWAKLEKFLETIPEDHRDYCRNYVKINSALM